MNESSEVVSLHVEREKKKKMFPSAELDPSAAAHNNWPMWVNPQLRKPDRPAGRL